MSPWPPAVWSSLAVVTVATTGVFLFLKLNHVLAGRRVDRILDPSHPREQCEAGVLAVLEGRSGLSRTRMAAELPRLGIAGERVLAALVAMLASRRSSERAAAARALWGLDLAIHAIRLAHGEYARSHDRAAARRKLWMKLRELSVSAPTTNEFPRRLWDAWGTVGDDLRDHYCRVPPSPEQFETLLRALMTVPDDPTSVRVWRFGEESPTADQCQEYPIPDLYKAVIRLSQRRYNRPDSRFRERFSWDFGQQISEFYQVATVAGVSYPSESILVVRTGEHSYRACRRRENVVTPHL